MRRFFAVLSAVAVVLITLGGASASGPKPLTAPTHLGQFFAGKKVPSGGWSRGTTLTIQMQVNGNGNALTGEVELAPLGRAFSGTPNFDGSSSSVPAGSTATLRVNVSGLKNGSAYVWQARVTDGAGNTSPWSAFVTTGSSPALRIDTVPPSTPHISSSSNPRWGGWYRTKVEHFKWLSRDYESGVAGYAWSLGHHVQAPRTLPGHITSVTMSHVGNGKWVLHVWAQDVAGNWSREGYYKFNINRVPPKARLLHVSAHSFNPVLEKEAWTFTLNERARVTVQVARSGLSHYVISRNLGRLSPGRHEVVWNGRVHGRIARHGWYWIRVFTRDSIGNRGEYGFGGVSLWPYRPRLPFYPRRGRHIVVSLSKQAIYAYNGDKLVWKSLATTGNPALPTPAGHFRIFAKFSPFTFISPWPPGSPYWYPPSPVHYAMEFISGGYFIHDAPWRSVFGPGSNGPGQPGTNYGGTHGCVNVPLRTARFLYSWASIGTPVDVLR